MPLATCMPLHAAHEATMWSHHVMADRWQKAERQSYLLKALNETDSEPASLHQRTVV